MLDTAWCKEHSFNVLTLITKCVRDGTHHGTLQWFLSELCGLKHFCRGSWRIWWGIGWGSRGTGLFSRGDGGINLHKSEKNSNVLTAFFLAFHFSRPPERLKVAWKVTYQQTLISLQYHSLKGTRTQNFSPSHRFHSHRAVHGTWFWNSEISKMIIVMRPQSRGKIVPGGQRAWSQH